ncbi:MAG: hypothetical protein U0996_25940 [Planctomycetaceae bacterium]
MGWLFEILGRLVIEVLFEALFHVPGIAFSKLFLPREERADGCLVTSVSLLFWFGLGVLVWWIF